MRLLFDIETDGLDPSRIWCVAAVDIDTEKVYFYGPTNIPAALVLLHNAACLVGHNIIGFDLPVLKKLHKFDYSGKVVDTLILSKIFKATLPSHSLEYWGTYFKQPKMEHEDWSQFSPEMQERCISDVLLNLKLFKFFVERKHRISKDVSELEHFIAQEVSKMTEHGFLLDKDLAENTLGKLRRRKHRLEMKLNEIFCALPNRGHTYTYAGPEGLPEGCKELKLTKDGKISGSITRWADNPADVVGPFSRVAWTDVNFNSGPFLIRHLMMRGWVPDEFTEKGNAKLGEEQLDRLAGSSIPDAALLGAWSVMDRRITQIQSWLDATGRDNRVHATIRTPGTWTYRMTHSKPNMSAVPGRGKPYANICRSMWRVPTGHKLVGCDASGIQLRVLANAMADPDYSHEVVFGDVHTRNQSAAGLPSRDTAKTFIYAFLLGAGDAKLGQIAGEPPESQAKRGKILRRNFLTAIPSYAKLLEGLKRQAKQKEHIIGLDGRRVYCPDPHYALAGLLQNDEAVIMKKAYWFWSQRVPAFWDAHLVQWSHDEWQVEVKEEYAHDLGKLMVDSFKDVQYHYHTDVELDGEYHVGSTWKDTH